MTALTDIQRKISEVERLRQQEQEAEQTRLAAEKEHQRKIAAAEKELRELRRQELTVRIAADKDFNQALVDENRRLSQQEAQVALAQAAAQFQAAIAEPLKILARIQELAEQQNSHAIHLYNDVMDFAFNELKADKRAELIATYGSETRADLEIEMQAKQSRGKIGGLQAAWGYQAALGLFIQAAPTVAERNLRRGMVWYLIIALSGQEMPAVPDPPDEYHPQTEWHYPQMGG